MKLVNFIEGRFSASALSRQLRLAVSDAGEPFSPQELRKLLFNDETDEIISYELLAKRLAQWRERSLISDPDQIKNICLTSHLYALALYFCQYESDDAYRAIADEFREFLRPHETICEEYITELPLVMERLKRPTLRRLTLAEFEANAELYEMFKFYVEELAAANIQRGLCQFRPAEEKSVISSNAAGNGLFAKAVARNDRRKHTPLLPRRNGFHPLCPLMEPVSTPELDEVAGHIHNNRWSKIDFCGDYFTLMVLKALRHRLVTKSQAITAVVINQAVQDIGDFVTAYPVIEPERFATQVGAQDLAELFLPFQPSRLGAAVDEEKAGTSEHVLFEISFTREQSIQLFYFIIEDLQYSLLENMPMYHANKQLYSPYALEFVKRAFKNNEQYKNYHDLFDIQKNKSDNMTANQQLQELSLLEKLQEMTKTLCHAYGTPLVPSDFFIFIMGGLFPLRPKLLFLGVNEKALSGIDKDPNLFNWYIPSVALRDYICGKLYPMSAESAIPVSRAGGHYVFGNFSPIRIKQLGMQQLTEQQRAMRPIELYCPGVPRNLAPHECRVNTTANTMHDELHRELISAWRYPFVFYRLANALSVDELTSRYFGMSRVIWELNDMDISLIEECIERRCGQPQAHLDQYKIEIERILSAIFDWTASEHSSNDPGLSHTFLFAVFDILAYPALWKERLDNNDPLPVVKEWWKTTIGAERGENAFTALTRLVPYCAHDEASYHDAAYPKELMVLYYYLVCYYLLADSEVFSLIELLRVDWEKLDRKGSTFLKHTRNNGLVLFCPEGSSCNIQLSLEEHNDLSNKRNQLVTVWKDITAYSSEPKDCATSDAGSASMPAGGL